MLRALLLPLLLACHPADTGVVADSEVPIDTATDCTASDFTWGEGGEDMLPGLDCLGCHSADGRAADVPYTVAGTVFTGSACPVGVGGASVVLTDAVGVSVSLSTSSLGNFSTAEHLVAPLDVTITSMGATTEMSGASGACNACHTLDGADLVWVSP